MRRRVDFPVIGHYDTWLTDSLQLLVRKNHSIILHPGWVNASDYKDTPESFNTVPLHSQELATREEFGVSSVEALRKQAEACDAEGRAGREGNSLMSATTMDKHFGHAGGTAKVSLWSTLRDIARV